jgi:hypothetical protein
MRYLLAIVAALAVSGATPVLSAEMPKSMRDALPTQFYGEWCRDIDPCGPTQAEPNFCVRSCGCYPGT